MHGVCMVEQLLVAARRARELGHHLMSFIRMHPGNEACTHLRARELGDDRGGELARLGVRRAQHAHERRQRARAHHRDLVVGRGGEVPQRARRVALRLGARAREQRDDRRDAAGGGDGGAVDADGGELPQRAGGLRVRLGRAPEESSIASMHGSARCTRACVRAVHARACHAHTPWASRRSASRRAAACRPPARSPPCSRPSSRGRRAPPPRAPAACRCARAARRRAAAPAHAHAVHVPCT